MPHDAQKPYWRAFAKLTLAILAISYNADMYLHWEPRGLIHTVNLVFHEAGHAFLMFFGQFFHILGGTIFEILIPSIIAYYFYRNHDRLGTAFCLWWLSTALMDVSSYAADARSMVLPLLGGGTSGHDWNNLLGMLGWLEYDQIVGYSFFMLSLSAFLLSLYSLWLSIKKDSSDFDTVFTKA